MSSGGFFKHFGFVLPAWVAFDPPGSDPAKPPRDGLPVAGHCHLCKRESGVTYRRGDDERVCITCVAETVRVIEKKRRFSIRRRPAEYGGPSESEPPEAWAGESRDWWESKFS